MWIPKDRFESLVKAEAQAEMLVARVNQLEHELATARFQLTGQPQMVTKLARAVGKPFVPPGAVANPQDSGLGPQDFEDMGDAEARIQGVNVDEDGRVKL